MARAVADAIETDGHAVVQAGTGTGKSLAYLVPAVLSDRPTVIATATKALQDQLAGKDLPFLADHLDVPFRFAVLKGRRIISVSSGSTNSRPTTDSISTSTTPNETAVRSTARRSTSCEPSPPHPPQEIAASSRRSTTAPGASSPSDATNAPGQPLPQATTVSPRRLATGRRSRHPRRQPAPVRLAITVDAVLPEHDLVMIDEAHQLEDIVAEAAGRQISPARVQAAARNTASVLVDMEPSQRAEESATSLHVALEPLIGERLLDGPDAEVGKALDDVRGHRTAARCVASRSRQRPGRHPHQSTSPGKSPPA